MAALGALIPLGIWAARCTLCRSTECAWKHGDEVVPYATEELYVPQVITVSSEKMNTEEVVAWRT